MNPNINHIRMCQWEITLQLQILPQVYKLRDKFTNPNKKAHKQNLSYESMLASKSNDIHINLYIQLL